MLLHDANHAHHFAMQRLASPSAPLRPSTTPTEGEDAVARNAPLGIQVTKEAGRTFMEAGERAAIAYVPRIRERVLNSADAAEGIKSFVERREGRFTGS
jgi:hypothetical protein